MLRFYVDKWIYKNWEGWIASWIWTLNFSETMCLPVCHQAFLAIWIATKYINNLNPGVTGFFSCVACERAWRIYSRTLFLRSNWDWGQINNQKLIIIQRMGKSHLVAIGENTHFWMLTKDNVTAMCLTEKSSYINHYLHLSRKDEKYSRNCKNKFRPRLRFLLFYKQF